MPAWRQGYEGRLTWPTEARAQRRPCVRRFRRQRRPQAIGPYSPAIRTGNLLFISGQIPLDPATGTLIAGDIAIQTDQVMRNLAALLRAAGAGFEHVVRTTVFLSDLNEFVGMNEVYARYVVDPPPARATVQVARLPRDVKVEIDAIAVIT